MCIASELVVVAGLRFAAIRTQLFNGSHIRTSTSLFFLFRIFAHTSLKAIALIVRLLLYLKRNVCHEFNFHDLLFGSQFLFLSFRVTDIRVLQLFTRNQIPGFAFCSIWVNSAVTAVQALGESQMIFYLLMIICTPVDCAMMSICVWTHSNLRISLVLHFDSGWNP